MSIILKHLAHNGSMPYFLGPNCTTCVANCCNIIELRWDERLKVIATLVGGLRHQEFEKVCSRDPRTKLIFAEDLCKSYVANSNCKNQGTPKDGFIIPIICNLSSCSSSVFESLSSCPSSAAYLRRALTACHEMQFVVTEMPCTLQRLKQSKYRQIMANAPKTKQSKKSALAFDMLK
ncbi:hypothetical protein ACFE04_026938 [Oxalis oulophora]